MLYTTESKTVA